MPPIRRRASLLRVVFWIAALTWLTPQHPVSAQEPGARLVSRATPDQFAVLIVNNRRLITFRASIVPQDPAARAAAASRSLSRLADDGITGPVAFRTLFGASVVTVAGSDVFAIVPEDVDPGSSEDLSQLTLATLRQVELVLAESAEARAPGRLAWAVARTALATMLLVVWGLVIRRMSRATASRLLPRAEAALARSRVGSDPALVRATRLLDVAHGLARVISAALVLVAVYVWLTFALRQFPFTRPWGESLG